MMKSGYFLSKIEKHAYYINLLPSQFMHMTIKELYTCFGQQMEKIENENDFNNRRTARICTIIANANRDKKKKPKPFIEDDFMPKKVLKNKKKQSINSMATVLKAITMMNGGKVVN